MNYVIPISSADPSQTGHARRQAASIGAAIGFGNNSVGELSIIVTEAARNIAAHASQGEIILTPWTFNGKTGIDVFALDRGQGISDLGRAFEDGYSTAGTA